MEGEEVLPNPKEVLFSLVCEWDAGSRRKL
jgi:hypothetical protein